MLTVRIICEDFSSTPKIFSHRQGKQPWYRSWDVGVWHRRCSWKNCEHQLHLITMLTKRTKNVEFDIVAVLGGTVSISLDGLQLLWQIKWTNKQTKTANYSFYSPGWQTEMRAELSSLWDFGRRFAQHDQVGLGIITNIMIIVVRVEVDEIENIQKEVENDAIDLDSVAERWVLMTVLLGGRCH